MRTPVGRIIDAFREENPEAQNIIYLPRYNKLNIFGYLVQRAVTNNFPRLFKGVAVYESMAPTIGSDDIFVSREIMYLGTWFDPPYPDKGDIVVLWHPDTFGPIVKRVAGLPGDERGIGIIPKKHVYVLGDNREHSGDSRSFGPVPIQNVFGIVEWIERDGVITPIKHLSF